MDYQTLKSEILTRAKAADACTGQYGRAYGAETADELMTVIKDNFHFCYTHGIVDGPLIEQYKELFSASKIYVNVDVTEGFLLAFGNATVRAFGNATVRAFGNATVRAFGNATVEACDNATVEACDNAIEVTLNDNSIYRVRSTNTVYFQGDALKFEKRN